MRNDILRVVGVLVLSGCLPTYEPGAPSPARDPAEEQTGPERVPPTSQEPVAVRPELPQDQVSIYRDQGDPAAIAARAMEEGALDIAARRHSCMKMKYETLGRLLQSRGVNMGTLPVTLATDCTAPPFGVTQPVETLSQTARYVYCDSRLTLGYPQYAGRLSEATSPTTASATKQADLFVTAAQELVNAANPLGTLRGTACMEGGAPARLFNPDNTCNEAGVTCLQGYPATADQLALCNRLVLQADITPARGGRQQVDAVTTGKQLAVAAILMGVHICE
ncbi:MAG: hypothetical protein RMK29_09645 [Myxococcales bacterium]|nr:hypothetical protein [Myxococcota bacterium]MDW8281964.1 hypothetical protein [Myxococcales bacterium]